ncbi:MAG: hypothetical protein OXN89_24135 [Bryobacterales bacterium]|nr:hypothetical protein [Bryobacterales bacterium]
MGGAVRSTYVPMEMTVSGTGQRAMANEDGRDDTVDGAKLPQSGTGSITTSDGADVVGRP